MTQDDDRKKAEAILDEAARRAGLKAMIKELKDKLGPLEEELRQLEQQAIERRSPIKVGDIITFRKNRRGKVIRVANWHGDFMYDVLSIRKDGLQGQEHRAYHWDNPVKVE